MEAVVRVAKGGARGNSLPFGVIDSLAEKNSYRKKG